MKNNTHEIPTLVMSEYTDVILPSYESSGASGADIRAYGYSYPYDLKTILHIPDDGYNLLPNQRLLIRTGIKFAIPEGYEIQVRDRSGLALKHGIVLVNGVGTLDEDYRGEVGIILLNTDNKSLLISKGDRIAQLVLMKVEKMIFKQVDTLDDTNRGEGGFGSTKK